MCIKTERLPVLTLYDLDPSNFGFIFLPLEDFMYKNSLVAQPHKSSYYTIMYCRAGNGNVYTDKELICIENQTIACIGSNSVNRFELKENIDGYILFFTEAFFSLRYNQNVLYYFDFLRNKNACYKYLSEEKEKEVWSFYMEQIRNEYSERGKGAAGILRSQLHIVLSLLEKSRNGNTKVLKGISEKSEKFHAFEQLVEKHFSRQKLPSFYANELHISVNYLNRICQESSGSSSGEIIRKRVILEAERLLFHTNMAMSEISDELGFESTSYFSTFFKKHTDISPDRFRKTNKTF
jgi:AraC family transcriptional activator of pobA